MGEEYASYSSRDLTERLFAWSFMVAVEAGLRWGDLLNTGPSTTVLMEEGRIGFAEKPKPGERPTVDHGGRVVMHFLTENGCIDGASCSKTSLEILAGIFG